MYISVIEFKMLFSKLLSALSGFADQQPIGLVKIILSGSFHWNTQIVMPFNHWMGI